MNTTSSEVQNYGGKLDLIKWAVAILLMSTGLYGYHYYNDYQLVYRALALIPIVGCSLFSLSLTSHGVSCLRLFREAILEARRVVWPTRQESTQTTLIVAAVVFIAALILWFLDVILNWLTSAIMV